MTDWCLIHFVSPKGNFDSTAIQRILRWAERNGWRSLVKGAVETELEESPPWREAHSSLVWNNAPATQTVDVYSYESSAENVRVLGVDVSGYYFAGFFSQDTEKREMSGLFVDSLYRLLEHAIGEVRPSFGWGDAEANFPLAETGDPKIIGEDEVFAMSRKRINKPWLLYLGPLLIKKLGTKRVQQLKAARRKTVAGGVLVLSDESPF